MKFLVDTQLPPKLARYLKGKGYDCIHTTHYKDGHLLPDAEIVRIAINDERSVITKDVDFKDNYYLRGAPPKILLLRFGNISNNELISFFEKYFNDIVTYFNQGNDIIEFGRSGIIIG